MYRSSSCAWRILLACVLVAGGTSTWGSDPVYKCRGADGQPHYQATPCPSAQRTEWVRDYPPDPPSAASPATSATSAAPAKDSSRPRARTAARRQKTAAQGAVISMHRNAAACERAKKARDQAYARLGLKRDFAASRKLDDRVNDACR
ncbi:uncharacterized protein DUF4124 [Pseudoxanthomonas sp. 3HH-4]|uniref:DUF4124 domain-containing protein n=1 Tax=Pseudoxanthomonas sp. 3HH-4 TaxID=1690214 RepID=UPI0011522356|nr:DUF4124 domain-containing protein [Pseudoxanthomonas sp. 3HH-4]TQM10688.1 uncharacterized protein DUF4124 [Pseudoxanthomonas sp. 3HH-4]